MPKIKPKTIILVIAIALMIFIAIRSIKNEKETLTRKVEQRKILCDASNFTFYIDRCNAILGCKTFCYHVQGDNIIDAYEFKTYMGSEHMIKMKRRNE